MSVNSNSFTDNGDGTWSGEITVGETWPKGEYTSGSIWTEDTAGNHAYVSPYLASFVLEDDENSAGTLGDCNGDGEIFSDDLTVLARHVARIDTISDDTLLHNADTNQDGNVDADDLTHLAKYIARIIDTF